MWRAGHSPPNEVINSLYLQSTPFTKLSNRRLIIKKSPVNFYIYIEITSTLYNQWKILLIRLKCNSKCLSHSFPSSCSNYQHSHISGVSPLVPWQRSRTSRRSRSPGRRSPVWAAGGPAGPTYWPRAPLEPASRGSGSPEEGRSAVELTAGQTCHTGDTIICNNYPCLINLYVRWTTTTLISYYEDIGFSHFKLSLCFNRRTFRLVK